MVTGIGVDIVAVERCLPWVARGVEAAHAVLNHDELIDCFGVGGSDMVIAQRLAARFAAKEAFYKALTASLETLGIVPLVAFSFLFTSQYVTMYSTKLGNPVLRVAWDAFQRKIGQPLPSFNVQLSFSHEKYYAVAFVTLSVSRQGDEL